MSFRRRILVVVLLMWSAASLAQTTPDDTAPSPAPQGETQQAEPPKEPTEGPNASEPQDAKPPATAPRDSTSLCLLIESAARTHDLPVDFFTRLIWRESSFRTQVEGPVTRSGQRAQGIAQFMPGTAAERGLIDPFDPIQALPKSAEFIAELRARFGNLGLAAAAYNSGPNRVEQWLAGSRTLPSETQSYVLAITGLAADDWRNTNKDLAKREPNGRKANCEQTVADLRGGAPGQYFVSLQERVAAAATSQPWGVQLSAGFSRDQALAMYGRSMQVLEPLLGSRDPIILAAPLRSRGTRIFFQVRMGAESRVDANDLCGRIKRLGRACLVLRNQGYRAG
jgi:hypothetical protein